MEQLPLPFHRYSRRLEVEIQLETNCYLYFGTLRQLLGHFLDYSAVGDELQFLDFFEIWWHFHPVQLDPILEEEKRDNL